MSTILDSKYVDVLFEGGALVVKVPAKQIALEALKPALLSLKAKIPGDLDDKLIDKIITEIEAA
jgi:hypothetical protein